jgi:hypothetical protein
MNKEAKKPGSREAGKKKRSRTWVTRTTWGDGRFMFLDRIYVWKGVPGLTHVRVKPTENFESTREVTVQYLGEEKTLLPVRPTEYK